MAWFTTDSRPWPALPHFQTPGQYCLNGRAVAGCGGSCMLGEIVFSMVAALVVARQRPEGQRSVLYYAARLVAARIRVK